MRLIDADALEGRILMDAPGFMDGGSEITKAFILAMVRTRSATPTIDAVPVVRCKNCQNWIPGYITDQDDFIPPKCGKYQQMVGHSSDDFCSLAERNEGRLSGNEA